MGRAKRIAKWLKKKLPTSCLCREQSLDSEIPSIPAPAQSRLPAPLQTRAAFNTAYIIYTGNVDALVLKPSKLFSQRNGIPRKSAEHRQKVAENNRRSSLKALQERLRLRNKLAQEARRRRSIVSTRSLSHGYSLLDEVSFFSHTSDKNNGSGFESAMYTIRSVTSQIIPPPSWRNVEQITRTGIFDKVLDPPSNDSEGTTTVLYFTKYAPALGGLHFDLMGNLQKMVDPPKCLRVKAKPQQEKWKIELQGKMEKALNNRELHITERKKKLGESFFMIEKARERKKLEWMKQEEMNQGKVDKPGSGQLDQGQDKLPTDPPSPADTLSSHDQEHEILHLSGQEEITFGHDESISDENSFLISRTTMTDSYLFEYSTSDGTMTSSATPIEGDSTMMLASSYTMSDIHSTNYESASTSTMSSGSHGRKLTPSMLHVKSDLNFATGEQSPSQWNIGESFQDQCEPPVHPSALYTVESNANVSEGTRYEDQLSATHDESSNTSRNAEEDDSDTDEGNSENSNASNNSQTILSPITTTTGAKLRVSAKRENRKLSTSLPTINRSGSLISQRLDPVLSMTRIDQENSDDPKTF